MLSDVVKDYLVYRRAYSKRLPKSKNYLNFEDFKEKWDAEFDGEHTYDRHVRDESSQRSKI